MSKFKVGDTVRLKSGGPIMTVSLVPTAPDLMYGCQWFAVSHLAEVKNGKTKEIVEVFHPEPSFRSFAGDSLMQIIKS